MKHLIVIAGALGALIGAGAALERKPSPPPPPARAPAPTPGAGGDEAFRDGVIACKFIADEFGDAALRRVLDSNEPTFSRRVHGAVGVEFDEFNRRMEAWMKAGNDSAAVR